MHDNVTDCNALPVGVHLDQYTVVPKVVLDVSTVIRNLSGLSCINREIVIPAISFNSPTAVVVPTNWMFQIARIAAIAYSEEEYIGMKPVRHIFNIFVRFGLL